MHTHQLVIKVDLRDVQLFNELLNDRRRVAEKFLRDYSDVWSFQGDKEACEELQCDIEDILENSCGCVDAEVDILPL